MQGRRKLPRTYSIRKKKTRDNRAEARGIQRGKWKSEEPKEKEREDGRWEECVYVSVRRRGSTAAAAHGDRQVTPPKAVAVAGEITAASAAGLLPYLAARAQRYA